MSNPSFIDRYRWWLFGGSFGVQLVASLLSSVSTFASLGLSVVAGICLLSGLAGFVSHAQRRRKERDAAN